MKFMFNDALVVDEDTIAVLDKSHGFFFMLQNSYGNELMK